MDLGGVERTTPSHTQASPDLPPSPPTQRSSIDTIVTSTLPPEEGEEELGEDITNLKEKEFSTPSHRSRCRERSAPHFKCALIYRLRVKKFKHHDVSQPLDLSRSNRYDRKCSDPNTKY
ncbi:hypothetical protein VNO80_23378 [Phaseolus coccineus]|uniref:Uncharacterized protein n=1 Tax=Phaseolus coccineus TaxID=3886 RepID=A0AAN9MBE3_PHACN